MSDSENLPQDGAPKCAECGGEIEGIGKIPPIRIKINGEYVPVCTGCGLDHACAGGGG